MDSLFLTVSAMTLAGLNTVNISLLNTFQQFLLFLLIMLGSAIFISAFVVHVRRSAFEKKFMDIEERQRRGRARSRVRTWKDSAFGRKSEELPRDEVQGIGKEQEQDTKEGDTPDPGQDSEQSRDLTPPARRGAPEMNGVSSQTGARLERTRSESETEGPNSPDRSQNQGIRFRSDTRFAPSQPVSSGNSQGPIPPIRRQHSNLFTMNGVGARANNSWELQSHPSIARSEPPLPPKTSQGNISRYFDTAAGWIARNSQFHGLSEREREKLGGYEYRAVSFLAWLVPVYFVLWQLLGSLGCAAWVAVNMPDAARTNGLNPYWVGAFNAVSAFNNSGMSLLDANMVAFQRSYYMLLTMGLLILAGNTCYPIFLRMNVWWLYKIAQYMARDKPDGDPWSERTKTLRFLLDHPRRCYTNLFPSQHTWWLAFSVFMLNGVDWAAFEILNIGNSELDKRLPVHVRVIDGLFQAFAVRSGGFYVVTISTLRISLQVLYVVMMYISVYPVVITMRNSNVYEERSLGIYAEDENEKESSESADEEKHQNDDSSGPVPGFLMRRAKTIRDHVISGGAAGAAKESNGHFVRQQLRAQLAHDAWWIVLALFLIMIVEGHNFHEKPVVYSVFNVIFEIVSAYGSVGISVGVPWAAYSFCGVWHTLSKLILCAVMIRGRHRGLPVAIDKAVLLPGEGQGVAEEEDGRIRLAKTISRGRQFD